MSGITGARQALAHAVSGAGIDCTAYPPDALTPPAAYVDSVAVDYSSGAGWSFCAQGLASASVVAVAQRNDRAGSTAGLEDRVPAILQALADLDGVRVLSVESGSAEIGGSTLPAVITTCLALGKGFGVVFLVFVWGWGGSGG